MLLHEGGVQAAGGGINDCIGLDRPGRRHRRAACPTPIDVVVSGHTHQAYNCEHRRQARHQRQLRRPPRHRHRPDRSTGDRRRAHRRGRQRRRHPRRRRRTRTQTALIARYRDGARPDRRRQVVGTAAGRSPAPRSRCSTAASGESPLGNLIADAQLAATDDEQGAVAAFMNPGGVRADLDAGPVTYEEAFTVQPFANNLVDARPHRRAAAVRARAAVHRSGRVLQPVGLGRLRRRPRRHHRRRPTTRAPAPASSTTA